jgi:tetratricopeptide (TPR) repeat protein
MEPNDKLDLKQRRRQADHLINTGEFAQADSVYHDIIRRYRDSYAACEKAYVDLGELQILLMELELAENYFKLALGYSPLKPHVHYQLGFTYSLDYQWDKATIEFRFCTQQDPERFEYWYMLGWARYQVGSKSGATECITRATRLRTTEADMDGVCGELFLHPDKNGNIIYARLAAKVAPESRYMKWMLKELKDLHQMARTMSPHSNGN